MPVVYVYTFARCVFCGGKPWPRGHAFEGHGARLRLVGLEGRRGHEGGVQHVHHVVARPGSAAAALPRDRRAPKANHLWAEELRHTLLAEGLVDFLAERLLGLAAPRVR